MRVVRLEHANQLRVHRPRLHLVLRQRQHRQPLRHDALRARDARPLKLANLTKRRDCVFRRVDVFLTPGIRRLDHLRERLKTRGHVRRERLPQLLRHDAHAVHRRLAHVGVRVGAPRQARPRESVEVPKRSSAVARVFHDVVKDADGDSPFLWGPIGSQHGRHELREQWLERG